MFGRIGPGLIITGIILYILFAVYGIVRAGIFIIFPFFVSSNPLSLIPFVLIISGFFLLFLSPARRVREDLYYDRPEDVTRKDENGEKKTKFGGLIMIGPIPILFGNDRRIIYILAGIAVAILLILILYYFG